MKIFHSRRVIIRKVLAEKKHNLDLMPKMVTAIDKRIEPHHKKEHGNISGTAKFQSCWPKTGELAGT